MCIRDRYRKARRTKQLYTEGRRLSSSVVAGCSEERRSNGYPMKPQLWQSLYCTSLLTLYLFAKSGLLLGIQGARWDIRYMIFIQPRDRFNEYECNYLLVLTYLLYKFLWSEHDLMILMIWLLINEKKQKTNIIQIQQIIQPSVT